MGYVPPHMYILTHGNKRYKEDFYKEQRGAVIGIAIAGGISLLALIGGVIYSFILIGG